ncbi:hypothetical protein MP638_000495 [Amoeboaphelidium occidentale]|nr:hypothetical protein MP638_000495 [Amoeboaphelidium occidentale]
MGEKDLPDKQKENSNPAVPSDSKEVVPAAVPEPDANVQIPKLSDEEHSSKHLQFVIANTIGQLKLSGIVLACVLVTYYFGHFFGLFGLLLIVWGASYVWNREMKQYKVKVRTEIERVLGKRSLETDYESVEWLNHILARLWLPLEPVISDIVTTNVNPIIEYYKPTFLDQMGLSEFTLGTVAPRVTSIKAYPRTKDDTIRFDMECLFQPKDEEDLSLRKGERNSRIVFNTRVGKGVVGVDIPVLTKEISFAATVSLQLQTMSAFPYVKTVSLSFPEHPKIEFILKPLKGMDIMDVPGLSSFLHNLIKDILGWLFVHPNALVLDLDQILNGPSSVESAVGVLLVHVYEGKDLKNVEVVGGKSDPYMTITLGGRQVAKTRVIDDNLNPYWNESFYVLVNNLNDLLTLQVFDKDVIKDRSLGVFKSTLADLSLALNHKTGDLWKPLRINKETDAIAKTKGEVRFDLSYYPVAQELPATAANEPKTEEQKAADETVSGVLRINIHQGKELDETVSAMRIINPYVEVLQSGNSIHRTKTKKRTCNPSWEDSIQIFVRDFTKEKLKFLVKDHRELVTSHGDIGYCEVSLKDVVQAQKSNQSNKIEWFTLRNATSGTLRLTFKFTPVVFDHPIPAHGVGKFHPAIGVLRLRVIEAKGLKNFEIGSISDPYVKVNYGGKCRGKTDVIDNCLNPMWNSVFYLLVQDQSLKGSIGFEIYDRNDLKADQLMGKAEFDLKAMGELPGAHEGKLFDRWAPVLINNKKEGQIRFEISFHPIVPAEPEIVKTEETSVPPVVAGAVEPAKIEQQTKVIEPAKPKPNLLELYNSGIVRLEIQEIELDGAVLESVGYVKGKMPSPYVELFDISDSIDSNETEVLNETNSLLAYQQQARSGSISRAQQKEIESVINQAQIDTMKKASLLARSTKLKNTSSGEINSSFEVFVKDIEYARILVLAKDHEAPKGGVFGIKVGGGKAETEEAKNTRRSTMINNIVLGKIDLSVKDLIKSAEKLKEVQLKEGDDSTTVNLEWHNLLATYPTSNKSVIGKFKLSASFAPVVLDETILEHEAELEATDAGHVEMEVIEAKNLPALDTNGLSDPFVNVRLNNDKVFKSKVIKKNCDNPRWNEQTIVTLKKRALSRLTVEVKDWNQFEESKLLGQLQFDCSQLPVDELVDMEYNLFDDDNQVKVIGKNGKEAMIHLRMKFKVDAALLKSYQARTSMKKKGVVGSVIGNAAAVGLAAAKFVNKSRSKSNLLAEERKKTEAENGSNVAESKATVAAPVVVEAPRDASVERSEEVSGALKPKSVVGSVSIKIVEGLNLKAVDSNGTSDPYVKVRYFPSNSILAVAGSNASIKSSRTKDLQKEIVVHKTKVAKKNLNPQWNEQFVLPFDVSMDDPCALVFSIKDYNLIGGGVDMGDYEFHLWDVLQKPSKPPVDGDVLKTEVVSPPGALRGGGDGVLKLEVEFHPFVSHKQLSTQAKYKNSNLSATSLVTSDDETHSKVDKRSSRFFG